MPPSAQETPDWPVRLGMLNHLFTPRSAVSQRDLFRGRSDQMVRVLGAVNEKGHHVAVFGERGVGKTSLARTLAEDILPSSALSFQTLFHTCSADDTYGSIWRSIFRSIPVKQSHMLPGFASQIVTRVEESVASHLPPAPDIITDDVLFLLRRISEASSWVVFLDEFDQVDPYHRKKFASTAKALADRGVSTTLVFIGVAETVDGLLKDHASIERNLAQIPMPRMSSEELAMILTNGFDVMGFEYEQLMVDRIVRLSLGLPHYTHLLGKYVARAAIERQAEFLDAGLLGVATKLAVQDVDQSISQLYTHATYSTKPSAMYKEVITACAAASSERDGSFSGPSVRESLRIIGNSTHFEIPNFQRHLNDYSADEGPRSGVLTRIGSAGRYKYKFRSPLLQPYALMRAIEDGLCTKEVLDRALLSGLSVK